MIGRRFGLLVVIAKVDCVGYVYKSICQCDCGNIKTVLNNSLVTGNTKSCGCLVKKHGKKNTPIYHTWDSIIARCYRKNHKSFNAYGGRGIAMCDRWRHSFKNFFDDMGDIPFVGAQIDRVNNDGEYSKENCQWSTPSQNCRHRRSSTMLTLNGVVKCLAEWVEITGLKQTTISERLRMGWPHERILTTKPRVYRCAGFTQPE